MKKIINSNCTIIAVKRPITSWKTSLKNANPMISNVLDSLIFPNIIMIRKKENVIISTVDIRIVSEHLQQQQQKSSNLKINFINYFKIA